MTFDISIYRPFDIVRENCSVVIFCPVHRPTFYSNRLAHRVLPECPYGQSATAFGWAFLCRTSRPCFPCRSISWLRYTFDALHCVLGRDRVYVYIVARLTLPPFPFYILATFSSVDLCFLGWPLTTLSFSFAAASTVAAHCIAGHGAESRLLIRRVGRFLCFLFSFPSTSAERWPYNAGRVIPVN